MPASLLYFVVDFSESIPLSSRIANKTVMRKVREALGFDRCEVFFTGAAPVSRTTLDFFASIGIPLVELYGMTEASGRSGEYRSL
jgi:long-subunit acyl-CoA synthetase (AMP-forming)